MTRQEISISFSKAQITQLINCLCPYLAKLKRLDRRTQDNQRKACESALALLVDATKEEST